MNKIKTAKLDARIPQELRDMVDDFAKKARLSKGQVVERALLTYFGIEVLETPYTHSSKIHSLKAAEQPPEYKTGTDHTPSH